VTLPFHERANPRDLAQSAAVAGRFHEVVVGASKALHGQSLDARDKTALRWADSMLNIAAERDLVVMPSADQLQGSASAVSIIRRAVQPDSDATPTLSALRRGIHHVLRGRHSDEDLASMEALRDLFSMVSRLALQADVLAEGETSAHGSWALLTTTSLS